MYIKIINLIIFLLLLGGNIKIALVAAVTEVIISTIMLYIKKIKK